MDTIHEQEILTEIEAFCARTGMAKTAFGRGAVNDPSLVADLEAGRELRRRQRERVRAFMQDAAE